MNINDILSNFRGVKKRTANSWQCKCPIHDDKTASMTVTVSDRTGKALINCHAGCATGDILDAVGLTWADLDNGNSVKEDIPEWKKNLEAEYKYYEPVTNKYLYSKLRYKGKHIMHAVIERNEIVARSKGDMSALYNVNKMLEAIEDGYPVYYAEGEKDCETLKKLGYVCVTAGGASDWRSEYAQYFRGAKLTIFADNDKPGREHAEKVFRAVKDVAWSCRIITPSNIDKGDISDVLQPLDRERQRETFRSIVESVPYEYPIWLQEERNKLKVNPDLLAKTFVKQNHLIVVKSVDSDNDLYYVYEHGVYVRVSRKEIESKLSQYIACGHASSSTLSNAANLATSRAKRFGFSELNNNENIINVKNGIIDIRTMTVYPHDPKILSTVQLDCNYPPRNKSTSTWDKFVNDLCSCDGIVDEEMKKALLEYLGLIVSNRDGSKAKKCCVLYSPNGNSGKSKLIDILSHLINDDNVASISFKDMSESRWATSAAYGKRLVAVGDQSGSTVEDSSVFKQMTGGDDLAAEFKGKDRFKFRFKGCILVATNTLPNFADDKGEHMIDRLMILHCRNSIPPEKRDINIAEKCYEERDGIFAQCLEALNRLIKNNLVFSECESANIVRDNYRALSDTLYDFIRTECVRDDSERVKCSEFHKRYNEFCEENGHHAIGKKRIPQRMEGLGIQKGVYQGNEVYKKIKFKVDTEGFDYFNPEEIPF